MTTDININTENKHGSDCSGIDGDAGRVLTLSNTNLTLSAGFIVAVNGLALSSSEYTLSNLASSSTITFTNKLWDAQAVKVVYYTIAGALVPSYESKTGADCSGVDGAANRVLTLANTELTQDGGMMIWVNGLMIALTDEYTIVHNSTGTTITFLGPIWDTQAIEAIYFYYSSFAIDAIGDIKEIILEHGISATLIRKTEIKGNMGEVTSVSSTSYNVPCMLQDITKKDRQIHEMGLAVPGNIKGFFYPSYPSGVTGQSGTLYVKVGDIIQDDDSKQWRIEQIIGERHFEGQIAFKVAILKNLNLDQE